MKKYFLCIAIIFLSAQNCMAKNCWVWSGDNITVYVEDTELEWNENLTEFSVTVIDVIDNKSSRSKFYFYVRDENWFYNIGGKPEIMPVSKTNVSGYILEFAQNYLSESDE